MASVQISVCNKQKKYRVNVRQLSRWARQILLFQKRPAAEIGIVLVNNIRIRHYNRIYRNKDKPTDVLAFSLQEGEGGDLHPDILGDVMISLPMATSEAVEFGRSEKKQLLILLIHGMLHLLGYDHERSESEARKMQRRENVLFKQIDMRGGR